MSLYLSIPILEVASCIGLLVFLAFRGKRHIARKPFSFFLISMGSWGAFIFMMRFSSSLAEALFWEKFVFVAILTAALLFYWFVNSLTGNKPRKEINYLLHILYFACMVLIPTKFIVSDMQMMWYGKAPTVGPLFPVYVLGVYMPIIFSMVILLTHSKRSTDADESTRYHYVLAGIIAMFIGGTTDYLPPIGVNMYPLGVVGNILFCLLATLAMLRYNLLEMKLVLRKGIAYSLTIMLLISILGSLLFLLSRVFEQSLSPFSMTVTIVAVLIAIASIAIFQPLQPRFQYIVDRWFLRERYDHLQALKQFPNETKDIVDLKQLASSLVSIVASAMQSHTVCLLLPSNDTGDFAPYSHYGGPRENLLSLPSSSLLIQTMKHEDKPVSARDLLDINPSLNALVTGEKQTLLGNQIELLVPLKSNHLVGILLIGERLSCERYSSEDRQLLRMISHGVAVSLENAIVYESMQEKHDRLTEAMDGIIRAMSLVMETRDPYTASHQQRVADLAHAVAQEMGLSDWQLKGIYVAGLLHDVGKMVVPAEILSKPSRLGEFEFSIIKRHPKVGYDILKVIEFPWPTSQAILQHHERLDGSGYPEGICGQDITLEARVLAVADVVEAMSSHRPYRPALGLSSALEEISRGKGVAYDPEVVDACLRLFDKKGAQFDEFQTLVAVAR